MKTFQERTTPVDPQLCFQDEEMMPSTSHLYRTRSKNPLSPLPETAKSGCIALLCAGLIVLSGCSSGSGSKPQVEGITFSDIDGSALKTQPTSLAAEQGTYVTVMLSGDSQMLGANWTALCGSALPPGTPLPPGQTQDESCGTFTPAHTMSGPIPSYVTNAVTGGYVALYVAPTVPPKQGIVTLYASATADPSSVAIATLTIGGQPITVGFAPAPPTTMQVGASAQIKAVLNNDVTNAGVRWSVACGSTDCGFFGPVETTSGVVTTYVAPASVPAGGTVQVTATSVGDPTKAISATISITP
jgi:hypothetical protein